MNMNNGMRPVHPGEVLREEFLAPLGMTAAELAGSLHTAASKIEDVVHERREVDAVLALRLARYFGGDAQSWLNLQLDFDLKVALRDHGERIGAQITPRADQSIIG
ncbi:addiction module antidote protein, HigA family [Paraburkholderia steynii]|uniref:Addiction module antidote protein, HigA family n=1 Tax=Paraburkholderia steynii TaxID=1245441 RepID=A0A4R0XJ18_9BURK|nr:addiction module antidote protein, HigA family [Paraburkholderia steynii]